MASTPISSAVAAYNAAAKAMRLAPKNGDYVDTAAETAARLGRWDEAVKLETRALKMKPGD